MRHNGIEKTNNINVGKEIHCESIISRGILLSLVACNLLPEENFGVEFQKYHHPSVFLAVLKFRIRCFTIGVEETGALCQVTIFFHWAILKHCNRKIIFVPVAIIFLNNIYCLHLRS
jgi:hypothetical protein